MCGDDNAWQKSYFHNILDIEYSLVQHIQTWDPDGSA